MEDNFDGISHSYNEIALFLMLLKAFFLKLTKWCTLLVAFVEVYNIRRRKQEMGNDEQIAESLFLFLIFLFPVFVCFYFEYRIMQLNQHNTRIMGSV